MSFRKMWLTRLPRLNPSYEHVYDFKDVESRNAFFESKKEYYIKSNVQHEGNLTYIDVNVEFHKLNSFDYLFYNGYDRVYFYFITNIKFVTSSASRLYLSLDVFNTYFYDVTFQDSFIDRMHVPRWAGDDKDIPAYELADEGLAIGEYQLKKDEEICEMEKTVVIASSVPLGVVELEGSGSGRNDYADPESISNWKEGSPSSQCIRYIKGYEGFGQYSYVGADGIPTIGYGCASHAFPTLYNELKALEPVSEEVASQYLVRMASENFGEPILDKCINSLNVSKQCQFDALVSLAYNSGTGSVTGENSLTRAIKTGDEATIRNAWENFKITSNGVVLQGLIDRRKEEANMFFGQYSFRPIVTINADGSYGETLTDNDGNGWLPTDTGVTDDDSTEGYGGHMSITNSLGDGWLIPVTGAYVSSDYGYRNCPFHGREMHNGIDLACAGGTKILAPKSGTVIETGSHSSMGNYTKIEHANGVITIYMHQQKILVNEGDTVKRCQEIGLVGTTGSSTGNHLHWEFRKSLSDYTSVDPIPEFSKGSKC